LSPPGWLGEAPLMRRVFLNKTTWMQAALPVHIARLKLDLCHFTNFVAPLLSPCPMVITIHDMTLWLFHEHHTTQRLIAMRPIIPLAVRRAGAIITVSESAKADIISILDVDPAKVHVVYEAPSAKFHPHPRGADLESIRAQYHLPEAFILYVGTLEPRKNLVRLLEAYASLLHQDRIPHRLVLVGSRGWKEQPIFEAVDRLGIQNAVQFVGHVPQEHLVALYNLADVLAFPSLYEGFGLPVVEAMACRTPVLTSPRGSLHEVAGNAAGVRRSARRKQHCRRAAPHPV
jgi:glycosyltransferase involved in cell wall biosynthesis